MTKNTVPVVLFFALYCLCCNHNSTKPVKRSSENAKTSLKTASQVKEELKHDDLFDEYPSGGWWREPSKLNSVVQRIAHILIRHSESALSYEEKGTGHVFANRSKRSKEDAKNIALKIRYQLAKDPSRFDSLAKRHSDDLTTSANGGGTGVIRAAWVQKRVINALAHLEEGEISKVFETSNGFNIVQRLPLPPNQEITGQQIYIAYGGATIPSQTIRLPREEAKKRVETIHKELRTKPELFEDYVQRYSDEPNKALLGDVGQWKTYHSKPYLAVLLDILSQTKVGGLTEIVETRNGYSIFRRTSLTKRKTYAAHMIAISVKRNKAAKGVDTERQLSYADAKILAERLLKSLKRVPSAFDKVRRKYCFAELCRETPFVWQQGKGMPKIEAALSSVPVGNIVDEVVENISGFWILRRQAPPTFTKDKSSAVEEKIATEIPNPEPLDLKQAIQIIPKTALVSSTRVLKKETITALNLTGENARAVENIYDRLATGFENQPRENYERLQQQAERDLLDALGPKLYGDLSYFTEQWLEGFLRWL